MDLYSLTQTELEETADKIKVVVLAKLVESGLVGEAEAEKWCERHTVILRKKGFFRTLSDRWRKAENAKGHYFFVVSK